MMMLTSWKDATETCCQAICITRLRWLTPLDLQAQGCGFCQGAEPRHNQRARSAASCPAVFQPACVRPVVSIWRAECA